MNYKQIYHNYQNLEEYHAGMWRNVPNEEKESMIEMAVEFTGNAKQYGEFMLKVTIQWPKSCEHNLTANSINKQAWIGHAACCLALGIPEHITRQAWHRLTQKQQDEANKKADQAIEQWERQYLENAQTIFKY